MTCDELSGLMSDFFSGDLILEVCESIRVHITVCERCDIIVQSVEHTRRITRCLPQCSLSENFQVRLRGMLNSLLDAGTE